MDKRYIIVAGVNGAGKTTLYRASHGLNAAYRVNADEIRRDRGWDWRNDAFNFQAGIQAVKLLDEAFANGESISQETTLTGHDVINRIKTAKRNGYRIEMHYVGVDSVDIAKKRIARRVSLGGHGIPDADVERRYVRSLANVKKIAALVDRLFFYDNSHEAGIRQIAEFANGRLLDEAEVLPTWYLSVKDEIRPPSDPATNDNVMG